MRSVRAKGGKKSDKRSGGEGKKITTSAGFDAKMIRWSHSFKANVSDNIRRNTSRPIKSLVAALSVILYLNDLYRTKELFT